VLVGSKSDLASGRFTEAHELPQDVDLDAPIVDVAVRNPVVAYPDELLSQATTKMLRHKVGRLPVVSREDPRKVVGYLGRTEVFGARQRVLHEEYVRERGWLKSGSMENPN
jgi:CIC family chloride channel protein